LGLSDLLATIRSQGHEPQTNPLAARPDTINGFWADFEAKAKSGSVPIKPQTVIQTVASLLPEDGIVVADAGTPTPFAAAYLRSAAGRQVVIPRGHGGLGYAIPGVLGAKLACPGATVVGMMGDGSFGMSAGELETVARLGLPVTLILFNNSCFGWIKVGQQLSHGERYFGVDFSDDTDYVGIAKGFGLRAVRVERPQEVEPMLRQAMRAKVPTFIDIVTECETSELPPVEKWHQAATAGRGDG
jgi:acetolactate synthase-1/2/3 large subunit